MNQRNITSEGQVSIVMKRVVLLTICCLFVWRPLLSHETAIRQVKSSAPFVVVNGHFVYPENELFTVMLTDSTVVLNGFIYVQPEKHDIPAPLPSREKDFLDWVVRYPADSAQTIIENGGTKEEARKFIDNLYSMFADSSALHVEFDNGLYKVKYRGEEVWFPLPEQKREPKSDYWENNLTPAFQGLCHSLEHGCLVLKGDGYLLQIASDEISPELIQELRTVHQRAVSNNVYGIYAPLELTGKCGKSIMLCSSAVEDIVKAHK